jgi:hypothetical protein
MVSLITRAYSLVAAAAALLAVSHNRLAFVLARDVQQCQQWQLEAER